jgi:hypothetical protein
MVYSLKGGDGNPSDKQAVDTVSCARLLRWRCAVLTNPAGGDNAARSQDLRQLVLGSSLSNSAVHRGSIRKNRHQGTPFIARRDGKRNRYRCLVGIARCYRACCCWARTIKQSSGPVCWHRRHDYHSSVSGPLGSLSERIMIGRVPLVSRPETFKYDPFGRRI